ncbi:MAG: extensin family protein [Beijerinckiaceae bacterium]|nr:extensin family protein [Beijerinckiaceae bacterium]
MARFVLPLTVLAVVTISLSGCSVFQRPQRPAWREQAEKACFAQRMVKASAYVQPASSIEGPGICGLTMPLKVTALANGTVSLNSTQTIGCPMTAAMDRWLAESVQPVAMARFGQPVAQIKSMGSYACRSMNNQGGARLSEHGFGNAIDIGAFVLQDGREITIVKGWTRGDDQEKAFLREVHAGACGIFTTVLSPGSNSFHYNHIHVDLAMHGNTSSGPRRYCKPVPSQQLLPAPQRQDNLPDPPDIDEELDVAQVGPGIPASAQGVYKGAQGYNASMSPRTVELGLPPSPQLRQAAPAPTRIVRAQNVPASPLSGELYLAPPTRLAPMRPLGNLRDEEVFLPPGTIDHLPTSSIRRR